MSIPATIRRPSDTPDDAHPTLSVKERDRRWQLARDFMDVQGVDALVMVGLRGRESFDQYLTNEALSGVVIMPRNGEPTHVIFNHIRYLGRFDAAGRDRERWVSDIRFGNLAGSIQDVLAAHGLAAGRVGVVGLASRLPSEPQGVMPYRMWCDVLEHNPGVTWVEVSDAFMRAMLPKSDEELVLMRRAAAIGEAACEAYLAAVAPGVRESEAYGAALAAIHQLGGATVPPTLLMRSGPEALGWSAPDWLFGGGPPRRLQPGDVIASEVFAVYGGLESQQQIVASVGPASADHRYLADVARVSYDSGIRALRPGLRFAELCEVMHQPLLEAGCWNVGPLVQTVSPVMLNGPMCVGVDRQPELAALPMPQPIQVDGDIELTAGMVLAFEPNALRGKKRICVGGTVVVTATGCEELNTLPCRLNEVE